MRLLCDAAALHSCSCAVEERERDSNGDDACVTAQPRLDRNLPNGKCAKAAVVVVAASAAADAAATAAAANHRN